MLLTRLLPWRLVGAGVHAAAAAAATAPAAARKLKGNAAHGLIDTARR
jgi:hypothetical protein